MQLRSVIVFLVIGLALLAAINTVNRLPGPPPEEQRLMESLSDARQQDVVVIGASTSNGIYPAQICPEGIRLGARDVFEIEAIVDFLIESGKPPQLFVITAAPDVLQRDAGSRAGFGSTQRKELYRAFHALGYRGLIGNDWRNLAIARLVPALGVPAWRHPLRSAIGYITGKRYAETITQGPKAVVMDPETADLMAAGKLNMRDVQMERVAYFDGAVVSKTSSTLIRIARRVRDAGSTLAIVLPPAHTSSLRLLAKRRAEISRRFRQAMDGARAEDALFIDMFDTPGVSGDYRLFSDSEHLNRAGARKYSNILADRLAELSEGKVPCLQRTNRSFSAMEMER